MVQWQINRGRHTDHLAGRHSIRTNQCPPPPSPHIFLQAGCPSCRPTNSIKALKATSTFEIRQKTLEFSSTVLLAQSPYSYIQTTYYARYQPRNSYIIISALTAILDSTQTTATMRALQAFSPCFILNNESQPIQ